MALHGNEAGIKYLVLIILKIIKKGKKTFIFLLRVLRRRNLLQDYPKTGKKNNKRCHSHCIMGKSKMAAPVTGVFSVFALKFYLLVGA